MDMVMAMGNQLASVYQEGGRHVDEDQESPSQPVGGVGPDHLDHDGHDGEGGEVAETQYLDTFLLICPQKKTNPKQIFQ